MFLVINWKRLYNTCSQSHQVSYSADVWNGGTAGTPDSAKGTREAITGGLFLRRSVIPNLRKQKTRSGSNVVWKPRKNYPNAYGLPSCPPWGILEDIYIFKHTLMIPKVHFKSTRSRSAPISALWDRKRVWEHHRAGKSSVVVRLADPKSRLNHVWGFSKTRTLRARKNP